jgi:hypothetical protein
MINHAYSVLYGRTTTPAGSVYSGLTQQTPAEVIASALTVLRGDTEAAAAAFAVAAVKILDASTFRAVLWSHDERMTLQPHEIVGAEINSRQVIDAILGAPGVLLQYAIMTDQDIQDGYLKSVAGHERAAAVLAGLVNRLSQVSA